MVDIDELKGKKVIGGKAYALGEVNGTMSKRLVWLMSGISVISTALSKQST